MRLPVAIGRPEDHHADVRLEADDLRPETEKLLRSGANQRTRRGSRRRMIWNCSRHLGSPFSSLMTSLTDIMTKNLSPSFVTIVAASEQKGQCSTRATQSGFTPTECL